MTKFKYLITIWCLFAVLGCSKHSLTMQGYVEGKYTYLSSPFAGRLDQLNVERGTLLKAGQLVSVLDQQPEMSQLTTAQHKLVQAQQTLADLTKGQRQTILNQLLAQKAQAAATFNLAELTLDRYQKLYQQKVIDKANLDRAQTDYQQSSKKIKEIEASLAEAKLGARENQIAAQQAIINAASAEVTKAKWALDQKTIYAPVAGQVFDTYYQVGELVPANQPIISMLAPENVKLLFFVPEPWLNALKTGDVLNYSYDGSKKIYQATVSFIASDAEYTPPVIYSQSSREKLVYRIEAQVSPQSAKLLHVGQPVDVYLNLR